VSVSGEYTGTDPITLDVAIHMEIKWSAEYNGDHAIVLTGGGLLTVESGASITNNSSDSAIISDGNVVIEGGTVESMGTGAVETGGNVTIDGGTVMANGDRAIAIDAGGYVVVNGGAVYAEGGDGRAVNAGGSISVRGGMVSATGENGCAAVVGGSGAITLHGNCAVTSEKLLSGDLTKTKGILIEGDAGTVYGAVTLGTPLSIPGGTTLAIPSGSSLTVDSGVTLTNNGEIFLGSGATLTNNGVVENNGGTVTGGTVSGTQPTEEPEPIFTLEHPETLDGARGVSFKINWNLSALKVLEINGYAITMTPSAGSVKRNLSGYPGYSGSIGEVVSGSTEITLYSSFMGSLAANESGRQTMSAKYEAGKNYTYDASTTFTAQITPNTPPPPPPPPDDPAVPPAGGNSGGGCDAGFAATGLFALALLSLSGFRRITKGKQSENVNYSDLT
jgi:hypothetical protein